MFAKFFIILSVILGYSQAAWDVTCDFDLEGIADIIIYLPPECQAIYGRGATSELYQSSLKESKNFAEFYKKLEQHERREGSTPTYEIPKQNTTLRNEIYSRIILSACAMDNEKGTDLSIDDKTNKFYGCLSDKREQMLNLIPK